MLRVDAEIAVILGEAVGLTCVATRTLRGTIDRTTPKAILLQTEHGSVWFPRKVLRLRKENTYVLAHWFAPTGHQSRILGRVEVNVVSAQT